MYCNIKTVFCFLGVFSEPLGALCMGPLVLLKVYGIALNMMKNTGEPQEIPFYYIHHLLGRSTYAEMTNVIKRFYHNSIRRLQNYYSSTPYVL